LNCARKEKSRKVEFIGFEVAKRNVSNFLKVEMESIKAGDAIKILALEQTFERILNHPTLPFRY
jgi:hypothetical protein